MCQNVKDKLHALSIPKNIWKEFTSDIFGAQTGSHFEAGLIDEQSDVSFWESLWHLEERWNNLERGCIVPGMDPRFMGGFSNTKHVISSSVSYPKLGPNRLQGALSSFHYQPK